MQNMNTLQICVIAICPLFFIATKDGLNCVFYAGELKNWIELWIVE